jgi:hypothetical protein
MIATRAVFAMSLVAWILSGATGCATSRGVVEIQIPEANDPLSESAYKIVSVEDRRNFELKPQPPSIPSLKNGEIDDPAITSRAIARKRNGFGKALGDILLPEGRTVQQLTDEAIVRAFRESGLSVVSREHPQWDSAKPIEAEIQQLWAWMTPGFWALALDFDMRVRIKTDLGEFREGEEAHGAIQLHTQGAATRQWLNTINKGLEEFNRDLKAKIALALDEL